MANEKAGSEAGRVGASLAAIVALVAGLFIAIQGSSNADVTAVVGSAYGYRAFNITLFGGSQTPAGPTPTVTLASNASNSPLDATAACGFVGYGPANVFTSDGLEVHAEGSLGAGGSVTATSDVTNVNKRTVAGC